MATSAAIPHAHLSRRSFLTGVGAAAALGSAAVLGVADPAEAAGKGGGFGSGTNVFSNSSAPRPIEAVVGTAEPGFVPPPPFDFIHWLLPGPPGATTQILNLPAFGLDADPSLMSDYHGFTAYAVLAGSARGNNGEEYDVELDIRVMDGKYVGEDGRTHEGTFGFF